MRRITFGALVVITACTRVESIPIVPSSAWDHAAATQAIHFDTVRLRSAGDTLSALLARPAKPGRFPAVIVLHANRLWEPYIATTTTMLAQAGFVALAVDIFHFLPGNESWEASRRVPGDSVRAAMEAGFREPRMLRDIAAGIQHLRKQNYASTGGVAVIGFCGGGWNALLVAAQNQDVGAVVAFYAPLIISDAQHRSPMELAEYIRVPVQYHFALRDRFVSRQEADSFAVRLRNVGTHFERFDYDAEHGFFAHNRAGIFSSTAAALAWERTVTFLSRYAGGAIVQRQLAPPRAGAMETTSPRSHHALHND